MKKEKRFSPTRHIPHYSSVLIQAIQNPLLVFFALAGNFVTFVSAGLFYWVEAPYNEHVHSFFDAVWWAFSTVSTVGFGDIVPVTTAGRVVGIFLMIIGIGFFVGFTAVLVSMVSSITAQAESEANSKVEYHHLLKEIRDIRHQIDRLEPRP